MRKNKPEPGPHLMPRLERIDAIERYLRIGDDAPALNADATEFRIYNGTTGALRSYVWDEGIGQWNLKTED